MSSEADLINIQQSMNEYLKTKNAYFTGQNTQVENIFDKLSSRTSTKINDLKKQVDAQNQQLEKQIFVNKSQSNDTEYVKSQYQHIELTKIKNQNRILFYVYYLFVVVLGIILAIYSALPVPAKIGIIAVLLAYPFFIYYIQIGIYIFFKYIYSLISTSKYNNVYIDNY